MQYCPICQGVIFTGISGIKRCLNGHILSIPPTFGIDISSGIFDWAHAIIVRVEREPIPAAFQEAFGEGELEV